MALSYQLREGNSTDNELFKSSPVEKTLFFFWLSALGVKRSCTQLLCRMVTDNSDCGDITACSQSTLTIDASCHVCIKSINRAVAVKQVTCGIICHVICLVNDFMSTNGGNN